MNKLVILVATLLITLAFAVTINTTISNPSTSNVVISSALVILIGLGFIVFLKSDKPKPKKDYDGFTPAD